MFVVAGEALVDIVVPEDGPVEHAPGGSPLNVAVGLARLGVETMLVTELGDDANGRLVVEHLSGSGVRLEEGSVVPGGRTSTATARLDEQRAATYEFDLAWTIGARALPVRATGLHVGSIGATLRPGRDAVVDLVEQARERDLLVSFDPNARPTFLPEAAQARTDLVEIASRAQLVKLSDEDVAALAPGTDPAGLARELLGAGATRLVVVTHGGRGAEAFTHRHSVQVPPEPARVVDTVGAGDAFMAALLAVLHGRTTDPFDVDLDALLGAAHRVAAVTCGRRGANPPTREELPAGWPDV